MSVTSPKVRSLVVPVVQPSGASPVTLARPPLSTPRLLQASLVGLAVAVVMFWIVGAMAISESKYGVQTIGHDTAPSVVAAQAIRAHLANLDANAANAGLTRGQAQAQAWKDYAAEQALLSDYLVSAAQNITFGDAERKPILAIETGVQKYADLIGQARALMESVDLKQGSVPDAALALFRRANALINDELLPAAGALNDANESVLNDTWESRKSAFGKMRFWLIAAALPALIVLVWLQWTLRARTKRLLNPGALGATVLIVVVTAWAAIDLGASNAALTSAKQDAFDSVRAIWKSRAVAYSANTDESYFLLDGARKVAYGLSFRKKIAELADDGFLDAAARKSVLANVVQFRSQDCAADKDSHYAGLLGAELLNVTFEGECAAAANAYTTLAAYLDIDSKIRALDASGQHDAAIGLNVGVKPGESNFAFDAFDKALGAIIDINQTAFDASIVSAENHLAPLTWIIGVGGLLALALAFLGLRPRLNEYRS